MNIDRFWGLLEKSTLVQASVTLLLVGTTCYLWGTGRPVPVALAGLLGTVMGFWFGTKVQQYAHAKISE